QSYHAATSAHKNTWGSKAGRGDSSGPARAPPRKDHSSSAACSVLREIEHCPPSWVEAFQLAGSSGYWVGHSSERFAAELTSDREPGFGPAPGEIPAARTAI